MRRVPFFTVSVGHTHLLDALTSIKQIRFRLQVHNVEKQNKENMKKQLLICYLFVVGTD
jgi:hypothetical protein